MTLSWTATGDDSLVGTATRYEVLAAAWPITPLNFAGAIHILPAPVPLVAGSHMSVRFGVPAAGTWYFATRAMDDVGHWSRLSNLASLTIVADINSRGSAVASFAAPHPQPARDRAHFSLVNPAAGGIELAIYDIQGALVRTMMRGNAASGPVELDWRLDDDRGRPCPAGIYLARARLGGQSFVRRVVVTR